MCKAIIKFKNIKTGATDTLVKTGDFENTADGVLKAFEEGMYDKYSLVLRVGRYVMRSFYASTDETQHSIGVIVKETVTGEEVDVYTFKATMKKK